VASARAFARLPAPAWRGRGWPLAQHENQLLIGQEQAVTCSPGQKADLLGGLPPVGLEVHGEAAVAFLHARARGLGEGGDSGGRGRWPLDSRLLGQRIRGKARGRGLNRGDDGR
jgi:hypothetical protein